MDNQTGRMLHLQRLSTEDGPGIRTTVFLKGCTLRCGWCHNPESLSSDVQIQHLETTCIGCGTCLDICPLGCLSRTNGTVHIDRERCDLCGLCIEACPGGALEFLGKEITPAKLFHELIKDTSFFDKSDGGVTLSGGEPALQAEFCATVMAALQENGIHTALDTCGMVSRQNLEKILPHTDLVMFDLKEIDPQKHQEFTGQSNQVILENLLFVRSYLEENGQGKSLWVRTPLIPGSTATKENIQGIGAYLLENLGEAVERWELCAFNNLCQDKYQRLGLEWEYGKVDLFRQEELTELETWAKSSGFDPERIIATGITQVPTK